MHKPTTQGSGYTPSRRKRNVVQLKIASGHDGTSESPTELQRLPLKKRHGHTSQNYKEANEEFPSGNYITFGAHKFGLAALDPVRILPINSANSVFVFGKNSSKLSSFSDIFRNKQPAEVKVEAEKEKKHKLKSVPQGRRSSTRVRNHSERAVPTASIDPEKATQSTPTRARSKQSEETVENKNALSLKRSMDSPTEVVKRKKVKLSEADEDKVKPESSTSTTTADQETENQILVPLPPISGKSPNTALPQSSPTGIKKRRKVNRTGFPSVKKKKKSANSPATQDIIPNSPSRLDITEEMDTSLDSTLVKSPKIKAETEIKTETDSEPISNSGKKKPKKVMKGKPAIAPTESVYPDTEPHAIAQTSAEHSSKKTEGFSSSLLERVKIRKRNSVDGISAQDQAKIQSGEIVIPDVFPSLLNIPDPPIIMPEKTNYLVAGLLSDHYKYMIPPPIMTIAEDAASKKKMGPILPAPADLGFNGFPGSVLEQMSDYQLPFDIWCLGVIRTKEKYEEWVVEEENRRARVRIEQKKVEQQSRKAGIVKPKKIQMPVVQPDSWSFKRLRSNAYFGFAKPPVTTEPEVDQLCECRDTEFKCGGEDCLNRVVFTECPSACGENCLNRRIQKHEWAPDIRRFLTEDKGYGVKTLKPIKQGDFILEYVGEVVQDAIFKERMNTIYVNDTHHYCLQLDSGRVIDGHRSGGEGRFVNHSCEPNCEMQKWSVNGLSRMALFALRDIHDNEELSYDYNFSLYNPSEGQICHCNSKNCRGVIGGKSKTNTLNGKSKRKSGNSKGISGIAADASGGNAELLDKMKVLTRKERNSIMKGRCFLVRNYEKIRRHRGEGEDLLGDRLEKLMASWILRFKVGSIKNKPLFVGEDDPELARVARIAQIIYELFSTLVNSKDGSGKLLCEPFMEIPPRRKYPIFSTALTQHKLPGFKAIEKYILRGKYRLLSTFEADIRLVLTSFSQAYETERPDAKDLVLRITGIYKTAKQKAIQALDPFIVSNGANGNSLGGQRRRSSINNIPPFIEVDLTQCEDVVRCICGTFSEEGEMVQCETCLVWQHSDCMRWVEPANASTKSRRGGKAKQSNGKKSARNSWSPKKLTPKKSLVKVLSIPAMASVQRTSSTDSDEKEKVEFDNGEVVSVKEALPLLDVVESFSGMDTPVSDVDVHGLEFDGISESATSDAVNNVPYFCEKCQPREIDLEVPMNGGNDTPEKTYYLTLQREDGLLVRTNDTVYVLRDWPADQKTHPDGTPLPRRTYLTAGALVPSECDIFRIDSLFKDEKGNQLAMGYNYLRPHETHHEPSRRFYPNEILRAPIHEVIALDVIHGNCWVVDTLTYCKGRPKGCIEDHLYICDLRVDRKAQSFDKVGKRSQMICTKPFAFDHFVTKLKIQRNVHPHGPPSPDFKSKVSVNSTTAERGRPRKTEEKSKKVISGSAAKARSSTKARPLKIKRLHLILTIIHSKVEGFEDDLIPMPELLLRDEKRSDKARKSHTQALKKH